MSEKQKNRPLQFLIHVIVWGIIAFFPLIFLYSEGDRNIIRFLDFSLPIFFLMVVFYFNYSVLISRYLFNQKVLHFFVVNIVLFTVCLLLLDIIKQYYFDAYLTKLETLKNFPHRAEMRNILLFRDILSMCLTVGLATAIKMTTHWYQSQTEQKEREKLHIESELNNLKHQLNPHFLFNTLNNIYSLISINQENAQNAVHQLSNLIRYVLYESEQPKVPLSKDLTFMANYIQLMRLRLPSHVKLETDIIKADEGILIAPLLFISLVENAFKHGVSPTLPSHISVEIKIIGSNELECKVVNSNFPKPPTDKSGSGIGLKNLRKRLELSYPDNFQLTTEEQGDDFVSVLKLKL